MRLTLVIAAVLALSAAASTALSADLAFKPAGQGFFEFNTGTLRGKVRLNGSSQGISELVHVPTGVAVAHGGGLPGVLSYYRVFSAGHRWADAMRDWPTVNRLLPDGSLEVTWPTDESHPVEMTALFRLTRPEAIDLETTVRPLRSMPRFEVFLSSYFSPSFRALVYVKPNMFSPGKPGLLAADVNPLVEGTYLMFPRDRQAVEMIFDRRWEFPPNPVQWSVTRWLAGPMALRRDDTSGVAAVLMSPPDDCFAIATPYNKTPPDGVAGHQSLYLSLFGRDVGPGQTARARCRLVVGKITDQQAVEMYSEYSKQRKAP